MDGTLGLAGHAAAILEKSGNGTLIGLDADERNLKIARENLARFGDRAELRHANFRELAEVAEPESLDGILLDLGISSPHLDDAARGFSFAADGPLDMRLDATAGETAAEILARSSEPELADIFYRYGEIHSSRKLARAIIERRKKQPFESTKEFAAFAAETISRSRLPQIFQALRIAVNDELGALESALPAAVRCLRPGGRLAIISFHSLEDRMVKHFFRESARAGELTLLTKKPLTPTPAEISANPRARSALLRAAIRPA